MGREIEAEAVELRKDKHNQRWHVRGTVSCNQNRRGIFEKGRERLREAVQAVQVRIVGLGEDGSQRVFLAGKIFRE